MPASSVLGQLSSLRTLCMLWCQRPGGLAEPAVLKSCFFGVNSARL